MRDLLITLATVDYNTTGLAGSWELDTLTNGELLCMDQEGTAVDGAAPAITTDKMYFAVGRSGAAECSDMIDIDSLTYNKQAYTAPVAKIMWVGYDGVGAYDLNIVSPVTSGQVASVDIINKEVGHEDSSRVVTVEYVVQDGDTETTIQANLVTAINADARAAAIVTAATEGAAVGSLGIKFTAATAGNDFTVIPSGIIEDADVLQYHNVNGTYDGTYETATATVKGYGTAAQILSLETDYSTHEGNPNSNWMRGELYSKDSNVVSSGTYTTYTLMWREQSNNDLVNEPNVQKTLIIAIPSGETGAGEDITAMDNILASL